MGGPHSNQPTGSASRAGAWTAATAAFALWGLLPLYWKLLAPVPAWEVLAHRIAWTAVLAVGAVLLSGQAAPFWRAFAAPRPLGASILASALISGNGLTFIWAVAQDRVTEVSLGYYINPLLNVAMGFAFLRERPTPGQWGAIGLAFVGVAYRAVDAGGLPWPSMVLAGCFCLYGFVRKTAPIPPLRGLAVEMVLAAPVALGCLWLLPSTPLGAFAEAELQVQLLLVASGLATALPLWLFSVGARRLPYTTVGVIMFLAPSLQLWVAVGVYGEPFHAGEAITFGCIWVAVLLYLFENFRPRTGR